LDRVAISAIGWYQKEPCASYEYNHNGYFNGASTKGHLATTATFFGGQTILHSMENGLPAPKKFNLNLIFEN